jgi:hypothetical protein
MKATGTICVLLFLAFSASSAFSMEGGDSLLLRVPFEKGAMASVTLPNGTTAELGVVRTLPSRTNWPAYTASRWGTPGTVCATAVNAIHILIGVEEGRGRIFSLVPTVTVAPAARGGAFFSIQAPAGTGLFGGFAPLTGSRVFIETAGGRMPLTRLPHKGETLLIESPLPERPAVWMVDIENRPGGRVIAWTEDGPEVVARVVRPVSGVGRFGGTEFQAVGRIRASHAGVIDIATSVRGQAGGIQIMPLEHALTSAEMESAWSATQWMIVAPLPGKPRLEGTPPLFRGSLVPGTQLDDRLTDMWSTWGNNIVIG